MKIERYIMGVFETNTYLLSIDDKCVLIDPASKAEKLIDILGDKKLLAILLTHGHFDHIKAVDDLVNTYHCPVYINKLDENMARDKRQGSLFRLPQSSSISVPVEYLNEGPLQIGPFNFEVIYTPGHTVGSVCYKIEDNLFTGDTLFKGSVGRTDLPTGSDKDLKSSLRIIKEIEEDLKIYPGHEDISSLNFEKENNPYLY